MKWLKLTGGQQVWLGGSAIGCFADPGSGSGWTSNTQHQILVSTIILIRNGCGQAEY